MMRLTAIVSMALFSIPAALVHAAPAKAQPALSRERLTLCRTGPAEPSRPAQLRDRPTAICPYDLKRLYQRISELLGNREGRGFSVEKARYSFGLPALSTYYDSDRDAAYGMGVSGAGGWLMHLTVNEAQYPLDGKPAVFDPGIYPRRLVEVDALDVRYDITLILPDGAKTVGQCMSVQDAVETLERAGWKDDTGLATMSVRDGGYADPTFRAPRGGSSIVLKMEGVGHVATGDERVSHCLLGLTVMQPPLGEAAP